MSKIALIILSLAVVVVQASGQCTFENVCEPQSSACVKTTVCPSTCTTCTINNSCSMRTTCTFTNSCAPGSTCNINNICTGIENSEFYGFEVSKLENIWL